GQGGDGERAEQESQAEALQLGQLQAQRKGFPEPGRKGHAVYLDGRPGRERGGRGRSRDCDRECCLYCTRPDRTGQSQTLPPVRARSARSPVGRIANLPERLQRQIGNLSYEKRRWAIANAAGRAGPAAVRRHPSLAVRRARLSGALSCRV